MYESSQEKTNTTRSIDSIKAAAKLVAAELLSYYHGNEPGQIIGILPGPPSSGRGEYYWWEAGAMWGTMVDYWHYTKDSTWNNITQQAMVFQAEAPANSYMPQNWTASLGNDDQGFWGMAAMLAAEVNFQNPPAKDPQWLALAQAVFNTQAAPDRHDGTCGGGLRWQIPFSNPGYNYKNAIANGIFFNMGARLARYTDNATYAQYAVETWDWITGVGIIGPDYAVYDGARVDNNCSTVDPAQFSYNAAVFLQGAAFMYNYVSYSVGKTSTRYKMTDFATDQSRPMARTSRRPPQPYPRCLLPRRSSRRTGMRERSFLMQHRHGHI